MENFDKETMDGRLEVAATSVVRDSVQAPDIGDRGLGRVFVTYSPGAGKQRLSQDLDLTLYHHTDLVINITASAFLSFSVPRLPVKNCWDSNPERVQEGTRRFGNNQRQLIWTVTRTYIVIRSKF